MTDSDASPTEGSGASSDGPSVAQRERGPFDGVSAAASAVGAGLGVLAWGGVASPLPDQLCHLAPFGLAVCLLLAFGCALAREWRSCLVAVIGVVAWGGLTAPELIASTLPKPPATGSETLRLVQFNIRAGSPGASAKQAWIEAQDPDVIALEEVTSFSEPLLTRLSQRYPYLVSCETAPYVCSVVLLSKRPPLRTGHAGQRRNQPNVAWADYAGAAGRPYRVYATHIGRSPDGGRQARGLAELAKSLGGGDETASVLAGDFNTTPWSFTLRRFDGKTELTRRSHGAPTWPSGPSRLGWPPWPPLFAIDQIYAGAAWRTVSLTVGPDLGSDHRPLLAVLAR